MLTVTFWKDAVERALKTAAQAWLIVLGGEEVFNFWEANWAELGGAALGGVVLSLLMSIVSAPVGRSDSASLVSTGKHVA